jgi:hypothetical protein
MWLNGIDNINVQHDKVVPPVHVMELALMKYVLFLTDLSTSPFMNKTRIGRALFPMGEEGKYQSSNVYHSRHKSMSIVASPHVCNVFYNIHKCVYIYIYIFHTIWEGTHLRMYFRNDSPRSRGMNATTVIKSQRCERWCNCKIVLLAPPMYLCQGTVWDGPCGKSFAPRWKDTRVWRGPVCQGTHLRAPALVLPTCLMFRMLENTIAFLTLPSVRKVPSCDGGLAFSSRWGYHYRDQRPECASGHFSHAHHGGL